MAVKIATGEGLEFIFNPSFRVEGLPIERDIPTLTVDGRDGEIPHPDMARVQARNIAVFGHIYGNSHAETEAALDAMNSVLAKGEEVRLYRDESDTKFIKARFQGNAHSYVQGTNRLVAVCRLTFVAHDPYLYAESFSQYEQNPVVFTPPITLLQINNAGNALAHPVIGLHGRESDGNTTLNPKLTNYTTGKVVQFVGALAEGDILLLNSERHTAIKLDNNIDHSGTAQGGGTNYITLAADASGQDGYYTGKIIKITDGTGAGPYRKIIGYNGETKVALVATDWDTEPDETSVYEIYKIAALEGYYLNETMAGNFSGGTNVIGCINSQYQLYGFPLAPGVNQIEVEDENRLLGISIFYKARWF
jgi:phage-related protein